MKYGDKRDYRKIDIFVSRQYVATTTWASSLKIVKEKFLEANPHVDAYRITVSYREE